MYNVCMYSSSLCNWRYALNLNGLYLIQLVFNSVAHDVYYDCINLSPFSSLN